MLTIKEVQKKCQELGQEIFYYPHNNEQGYMPCCWFDMENSPNEFFMGKLFTISSFEEYIRHKDVALFTLEEPKKKVVPKKRSKRRR